ncbi:MAG TPA: hypothetical protein VG326_02290 [Tepidisphaeraceae bacterium]|jgi:hypothetical protein|nr:hypothetical protein [Tepidisphaeraceae bacterium]
MAPDFHLFDVLRNHGVPFVIVGGHAVNFHGHKRATEDADAVWFRSAESELALLAALTEVRAVYIGKEIDPATRIERNYPVTLSYIQSTHLMMLWTDDGFLDLFDYIPSFPTEDVEQLRATSVEADGFRYISLPWLHKLKQKAGRMKDLLDLQNLPPE